MGIADLKSDAKRIREKLAKLAPMDGAAVQRELHTNVIPLFEGLLTVLDEEVVDPLEKLEAAVDELIDQSEDVLHADTAAKILGLFIAGSTLATELEALMPKADEATRKRVAPMIPAHRKAVEEIGALIEEITLDDDAGAGAGEIEDDKDDAAPEDAAGAQSR